MGKIIQIPKNAEKIIHILEQNGFEGYVVGGCVRDMVLGREPGDWDITTSAKPEQVKALFGRTIDTGIQHGTVTVMMGKEGYEITTYRTDGEYIDHRHPSEVQFTPNLTEDLRRRDFTINAMAYNPKTGIIDKFGGLADIEKKSIRCVGIPKERFGEDALRMLRGIRFAGQLQFEIQQDTLAAIRENASTLVNVSAERIRTELTKLLISPGADRILLAVSTELTKYFLPELDNMLATPQNNPHHYFDVGHHSVEAVRQINLLWEAKEGTDTGFHGEREEWAHVALAYAALLHDIAKPDCRTTDREGIDHFYSHNQLGAEKAGKILRRLKFDNDTVSMVKRIILSHDSRHENCLIDGKYSEKGKSAMRRLMNRIGADAMPLLFMLQRADLLAQSDYKREEKLAKLSAAERCCQEIRDASEAVTIKDLAIGGREIMALGVAPGPAVGEVLRSLLELVLDDPEKNTVETLTQTARHLL